MSITLISTFVLPSGLFLGLLTDGQICEVLRQSVRQYPLASEAPFSVTGRRVSCTSKRLRSTIAVDLEGDAFAAATQDYLARAEETVCDRSDRTMKILREKRWRFVYEFVSVSKEKVRVTIAC